MTFSDLDDLSAKAIQSSTGKVTGAQSVDRALSVLSCFASRKQVWGIGDLSRVLDLSPSTVHRIVRAMVARGFLDQNEQTDKYVLGRMMLVLGEVAHHDYGLDRASPILDRVGAELGESLNLGVREENAVFVLLHVESRQPLRYDQGPGSRVPIHASAMGKAILAFSEDPQEELDRLGELERLTDKTLVDPAALLADLAATRKRGYAIDDEEQTLGVRCVGVPVMGPGRFVRTALAAQAPSVRMPDARLDEIGVLLESVSAEIAEVLQWQG